MATKVDIREFRAGLADYIAAGEPVAVSRHGQTVGHFIPARGDRDAEVAALRAAGAKLDDLLNLSQDEVNDAVAEFEELRRRAR
jgi:antitoxin (DNA-binding transcriptional repressor) of toxin-antitoxin stability system